MESLTVDKRNINRLYKAAAGLIAFTIVYNLLEGLVSVYFGFEDESLTLFGFGIDSFIEVISGIGIAHMIYRIQANPKASRDGFERTALRITGTAFYILVLGLTISSIYNIWQNHNPVTTSWGIIVSVISIVIMWALIAGKTKVGRELKSEAILADAQCTKVCVYMSLILLVSSAVYETFGIPYIDSLGTLGLAYFSFREGRECFMKAKSDKICCDHC